MSLGWNALIGKKRDRHFLERQDILKWVSRGMGEWGSRSCSIAGHRDGRKGIHTGLRRPGRLDLGT
jgi:hypothetical protein